MISFIVLAIAGGLATFIRIVDRSRDVIGKEFCDGYWSQYSEPYYKEETTDDYGMVTSFGGWVRDCEGWGAKNWYAELLLSYPIRVIFIWMIYIFITMKLLAIYYNKHYGCSINTVDLFVFKFIDYNKILLPVNILFILKLLCLVLIILALRTVTPIYYTVFRWLITPILAYISISYLEKKRHAFFIAYLMSTLLYNPILIPHFNKTGWIIMDCVVVVLIIESMVFSNHLNSLKKLKK
jgi:hypothetical protein